MAWVNWSRKSTSDSSCERGSLGIELTATSARAASGKTTRNRIVLLDDPHTDLPMAISLDKRTLELGRAAVALCRRLPHLSCMGHLPYLGLPREWKGGKHQFNALAALSLTFDTLRPNVTGFDGAYIGLPSYLSTSQVAKLVAVAVKSKFPLKGTAIASLAIASDRAGALLSSPAVEPEPKEEWIVPLRRAGQTPLPIDTIVIDADEHSITASLIQIDLKQVRMVATMAWPNLGVKLWKDRLVDSISDRCVRVCRRDPRDSAEAEQSLYEQIDGSLDCLRFGQKVILTVRAAHWYQDIELMPEDFESYCDKLVRPTVEGIRDLLNASTPEPPRAVWMTHEAGRLPGLARAVHLNMAERTSIGVLRPESAAIAVANLGERWRAGALPNTHLDTAIPLPALVPEMKETTPATAKSRR